MNEWFFSQCFSYIEKLYSKIKQKTRKNQNQKVLYGFFFYSMLIWWNTLILNAKAFLETLLDHDVTCYKLFQFAILKNNFSIYVYERSWSMIFLSCDCIPQISIYSFSSKYFQNFLITFSLIHGSFRSVLFDFQIFRDCSDLLVISNLFCTKDRTYLVWLLFF